jgi:hypothetical protein
MADEKKPKERKKRVEPETKDSTLATAAKIIGAAAGKIASLAGVAEPVAKPQTKSTKVPKLQKKDKSRLPRRQKKAQQKVAASQSKG